jgi:two-component system chemotaxis response regulator CheY
MYDPAMVKTIMIVDNSASICQALGAALRGVGYSVIEAINGQGAINKLAEQKVSLIISDLDMPVMGGIEFENKVKMMKLYCVTPIIILTTESEETQEVQRSGCGRQSLDRQTLQNRAIARRSATPVLKPTQIQILRLTSAPPALCTKP